MKRASASLTLLVVLGIVTASEATSRAQATPAPLPQALIGESTGEFKFFLAGVKMPDRWVGFFTESGGWFNHRCDDCFFAVGDGRVGGENMISGPRIVFKLSQDGTILTATCMSPACTITISEEATVSRMAFSTNLRSLKTSDTLDIPTKARVVFTVRK